MPATRPRRDGTVHVPPRADGGASASNRPYLFIRLKRLFDADGLVCILVVGTVFGLLSMVLFGPPGLLFAAVVIVLAAAAVFVADSHGSGARTNDATRNCPDCGAVLDDGVCEYCGWTPER